MDIRRYFKKGGQQEERGEGAADAEAVSVEVKVEQHEHQCILATALCNAFLELKTLQMSNYIGKVSKRCGRRTFFPTGILVYLILLGVSMSDVSCSSA